MNFSHCARTCFTRFTVLTFATLAASGCAAPDRGSTDPPGGSLAELQTGLPTGNPPAWYTEKLAELDYRVALLRYERSDRLVYEVDKGATAFSVQLALDPADGTATAVEIQPSTADAMTGAVLPDTTAAAGATPPPPAADTAPREPAPRSQATQEPETAPEPAVTFVALPAGTHIPTLLNDALDSGTSQAGDRFSMIVPDPISIAGMEVLPAGSRIWGHVAEVQPARRPNTGGRLVLKADSIEANGARVDFEGLVTAAGQQMEGQDSVREDIKEIAVGAGVGGLVGGLLGGGKGVVAGILIGAGGTFVATKGEQVRLRPDTPLYVELREEVRVPVPR